MLVPMGYGVCYNFPTWRKLHISKRVFPRKYISCWNYEMIVAPDCSNYKWNHPRLQCMRCIGLLFCAYNVRMLHTPSALLGRPGWVVNGSIQCSTVWQGFMSIDGVISGIWRTVLLNPASSSYLPWPSLQFFRFLEFMVYRCRRLSSTHRVRPPLLLCRLSVPPTMTSSRNLL